MTQESKPSSVGLRFLGMLKNGLDKGEHGSGGLCHYLPVQLPRWDLPLTFTIFVTPNSQGTFRATCREFHRVSVTGDTEEEALAKAEAGIKEILEAPPSAPDRPS